MPEDGRFSDGLAQTRLQRAAGRAEVVLLHRRGATRIAGLHQSGSAKAFLPFLLPSESWIRTRYT